MAFEAYRTRLGRELARRYGGHRTFTAAEVRTTARALGLSPEHLSHAYALYCTEAEFDAHHRKIGVRRSYVDLRREILPRFRLPGAPRPRANATSGDAADAAASFDLDSLFDALGGDGDGGDGGDGGGGGGD